MIPELLVEALADREREPLDEVRPARVDDPVVVVPG